MRADLKKKAIKRLRIISGQIKGLEKMVDKEAYCIDLINQIVAARQALSSLEDLMLENHLLTHTIDQIKSNQHKKVSKEIISVFKLAKRR